MLNIYATNDDFCKHFGGYYMELGQPPKTAVVLKKTAVVFFKNSA